jgi:conjugative relaxase-like TrwC/TraI family protein
VLGIGKIRPGRETYHLDAVADGVEDYYFAPHEAPGVWLGGGASSLGLSGQVGREQLVSLLAGHNPTSGDRLTRGCAASRGRARLPGYDVTLRAPKSVSLLWALTTDDDVRRQVQAGHDAAVHATLEHLEHVAAEARRGRSGSVRMATTGFVAAAFRHRTSRAGDPVLHTHLVIPNIVQGIDGRWSAPNGTMLYANAKSSGYVYQALLRGELTRRLGVAWGPVHHGAADLAGTSAEVIRAFSRRRVEIEERRDAIAAKAARQPHAVDAIATTVSAELVAAERAAQLRNAGATAQLAALETRKAKDDHLDMCSAVSEWRDRAAALGYDETARHRQLGVQSPVPMSDCLSDELAARLVGESGAPVRGSDRNADHLCARASTWSRRDGLMGWCAQLGQGAASLEQLDALTDSFLRSHPAVIRAEGQAGLRPGDGIRLASGGFVPARGDLVRYTTRRMRTVEEQLVAAALDGAADGVAVATAETVTTAIDHHAATCGLSLTPGQQAMVTGITTSGRGVEVVVGRAGSGKTTALAVARAAWESSGTSVHGAAKAAVAARHLELSTGIPSQTLDSLLADVRLGRLPLPPGGVLVLDEAATTETPLLAELVVRASEHRWKVVLVGDDQQLAEIDAGGGFRGLRLRLGTCVLSDNVRQREAWEREAVDLVRQGRAVEALATYIDHSRVAVTDTRDGAYRLMVGRWWRRRADGASELLQAYRNADVRAINCLVHDRRVLAGEVGGETLRFGVPIGVGDRVLTRLPARSAGIVNGMRGEVVHIDATSARESITVRLDDGATRRLGADYLSRSAADGLPALDLAYATTIHRNQGITAERSQVLIDPGLTADAAYVALSRGRASNELVLVAAPRAGHDDATHWDEDVSPRRALADCLRVLERGAAKHLSIDSADVDRSSLDAAVRREQLDGLVATWRRSMSPGDAGENRQPESATRSDPAPDATTTDPHLVAIEELLAAPRADVVDAVARYRAQLRLITSQGLNEESEKQSEDGVVVGFRTRKRERTGRVLPDLDPDDGDEASDMLRGQGPSLPGPRLG